MSASPLFTREGPAFYDAAYAHNSPFAEEIGGSYFTTLGPAEEDDFRSWVKRNRVPFDVTATISDYDMRGYWQATQGGTWAGGQAHFPDTWKTPYDTSFSKESRYATDDCPFEWRGERLIDSRDGSVVFEELPYSVGPARAVAGTPAITASANPAFVHLARTDRGSGGAGGEEDIGIGDGRAVESSHSLDLKWVRGINSRLSEVRIRGEKAEAILGNALMAGTLSRQLRGASSLVITVGDPRNELVERPILQEAHQLILDGLKWRLVKVGKPGIVQPVELTYEPEVVWLLRRIKGPHKAFRDRVTRAEFIKRLCLMVKPNPRFICPELHTIQPIAKAKEATKAKNQALDERRGGIDKSEKLTVKGIAATPGQIDAADRALRVAESLGAPPLAAMSTMLALIVESVLGVAASNWYEAEPFIPGNHTDLEEMTKLYLTGYNPGEPGAIGEAEAHPDLHAYEITQNVQRSGAGEGSGGAGNYGPWTDEAKAFLEAFGYSGAGGAESGTGSIQEVTTVRYAFKQGEEESNWACAGRLAREVQWDFFESAGWLYLMAEETLLRQKRRMNISPDQDSVVDISFDYDVGKESQTATVKCFAHAWEAPPGSTVQLSGCGVANGVYLVATITAPLAEHLTVVEVTLKKPTAALPEPAAQTKTKSSPREIGGVGGPESEAELGSTSVSGHPELKPGVSEVVNAILTKFPDLAISSTTGGEHATNSLHYEGRAADIAGSTTVMNDAAAWVNESGLWQHLTEGIHNPGASTGASMLSVKDKAKVPSSFWGDKVWADHTTHLHIGV